MSFPAKGLSPRERKNLSPTRYHNNHTVAANIVPQLNLTQGIRESRLPSLPAEIVNSAREMFGQRDTSILQIQGPSPKSVKKRFSVNNNFLNDSIGESQKFLPQINSESQPIRIQTEHEAAETTAELPISPSGGGVDEVKMSSQVIEEWLNRVLKPKEDQLLPDLSTPRDNTKTPSQQYGVDVQSLQNTGISVNNAKRLQRILYVHSIGLHDSFKQLTKGC